MATISYQVVLFIGSGTYDKRFINNLALLRSLLMQLPHPAGAAGHDWFVRGIVSFCPNVRLLIYLI